MNTYKITATTASGETLAHTIVEANESKARKAFREISRHGESYTIDAVQLVSENCYATKQQERDAIEQIKKLLEDLGPQSYVATALAGCLEDAENNIEDDAAYSMKERWELAESKLADAEKKVTRLNLDNRDLRLALEKAKQEAADAQQEAADAQQEAADAQQALRDNTLTADDLADCRKLVDDSACDAEKGMKAAALEIVTFAEDTGSLNFQNAVRKNRAETRRWNYLLGLRERIDKALGAGA